MITTADYGVQATFICWNKPSGGPGFDLYFGYNNKLGHDVIIKRNSVDPTGLQLNTIQIISSTGITTSTAQPEVFLDGDHTAFTDPNIVKVHVAGETSANWALDGNPAVDGSTTLTKCGTGSGGV